MTLVPLIAADESVVENLKNSLADEVHMSMDTSIVCFICVRIIILKVYLSIRTVPKLFLYIVNL